jgi:hypothetical protein
MAKLAPNQLSIFDLPIWQASHNAISLPGLAGGAMHCVSRDGQTTGQSGRDRARASRSVSQAKAQRKQMTATSGPSSSHSLPPSVLLSLWENRLRQRLASLGSTECLLTWKASVTPQGRRLSRLVPSMRLIDATDFGLWPTPRAVDGAKGSRTPEGCAKEMARKGRLDDLPSTVTIGLWPTPTTTDGSRGVGTIRPQDTGIPLPQRVAQTVAMWATPMAHEARLRYQRRVGDTKGSQKSLTTEATDALGLGENITGLREQTEKPGALNPQFVCWLMGFPAEWDDCAPTATPSSRKSRQKS